MTDPWTQRLSAYADDELNGEDRAALETHLATCAACRSALRELRGVVEWAHAYPGRDPGTDVWPRIASAIKDHPRGRTPSVDLEQERLRRRGWNRASVLHPIAAGIALLVVAGGGWWVGRTTAPPTIEATVPLREVASGPSARVTLLQAEKYAGAIAELELALTVRGGVLDSATVRVLQQKLAVIDSAITDARRALARDPNSTYLAEHFARMMRHKLSLLRTASRMAVQG